MSDYRNQLLDQVAVEFKRNTDDHVVEQLHRDGDTVRLWRCGKPGTCIYRFHVCCPPGWMMIYGDMGECMWTRECDMIAWARSAVNSLGYFSEKVPSNIKITEDRSELIEEWFDTIKDHWIEVGRDWGPEQDNALEYIREEYEEFGHEHDFSRSLFCSNLYVDCDDIPDTTAYTFRYLWQVEAIRWLIGKLDAREVARAEA